MRLTAGAQLRAGRALLRLERPQLAQLTGVSEGTIKRLERFDGRCGHDEPIFVPGGLQLELRRNGTWHAFGRRNELRHADE